MNHNFDPARISDLHITCLPGLGPVLAIELEAMGFSPTQTESTFVRTRGSMFDTYKLNLWLRTASHIHYKIMDFQAWDPERMYKQAVNYPWEEILVEDSYFSIHSVVNNENVRDTRFPNLKLKDAIVDRFYRKKLKRPNSGPLRDEAVIYMHWMGTKVGIYVDTSGNSLSRRGYRKYPWKAPLAESLAAALILSTGWKGDKPLLNPMGGSGTIIIEAALIAMGIPPGSFRKDFAFMHLRGFDGNRWADIVNAVPKPTKLKVPVVYNDNKRVAAGEAKKNMALAGLKEGISLFIGDFAKMDIPEGPGIVILNPPYGERLGEIDELEGLYRRIGDFFKQKCMNYKGYVFTANLDLAKVIGLRTSSRKIFYNAKLEARLLEYEMYAGSRK